MPVKKILLQMFKESVTNIFFIFKPKQLFFLTNQ